MNEPAVLDRCGATIPPKDRVVIGFGLGRIDGLNTDSANAAGATEELVPLRVVEEPLGVRLDTHVLRGLFPKLRLPAEICG